MPILAVGRWVTATAYLPRVLGNQPRRGNCHNHQSSIRARFVLGEPGLGGTNKRELQQYFFMQDADRSYLFILPNELLAAIASELLVIQHGDVVDAYHLAVFSLTCRRVYLSTRSVLFNHVPLASEAQIESLSLVPERLLKCIQYVTQHCRQGRSVS